MPNKRSNERSQLSKYELEAAERSDGTGAEASLGPYKKAPAEVLKGRKIIKTASKWKKAKGSDSFTSSSAGGNVFANFSFSKSPSSLPGSAAPTPAPTPVSKPMFAMPTMPTYNSIPAPESGTTKKRRTGTSSETTTTTEMTPRSKLCDAFTKYFANVPKRRNRSMACKRFVTTFLKLREEELSAMEKESNIGDSDKGMTSISTGTGITSTTSTTSSGGLFKFGAPSRSDPAPSKPPPTSTTFAFGSVPAPAPGPSPAPTPPVVSDKPLFPPVKNSPAPVNFSFGAPTSASSTTPPASGNSFKFSFSSTASSSSTAGTTAAPSFGMQQPASTGTADEEKQNDEPSHPMESADVDWKLLLETKVKVYVYEEGTAKKRFQGPIRFQQHKQQSTSNRLVMRSTTGKVLMNMAITNQMKFTKSIAASKPPKPAVCRIIFVGLMDEKRGAEKIILVVRPDEVEKIFKQLEEMGKAAA